MKAGTKTRRPGALQLCIAALVAVSCGSTVLLYYSTTAYEGLHRLVERYTPITNSREQSARDFLAAVRDGHRLYYDGPFVTDPPATTYRLYSPADVCRVISRFEHLIFLGDSFVRHLIQALFILITGDERQGGVCHWMLNDTQLAEGVCAYQRQFQEADTCRHIAPYSLENLSAEFLATKFCPGHKVNITLLWYYNSVYLMQHAANMQQLFDYHNQTGDPRPLMFLAHTSIHDGYNERLVEQRWFQPLHRLFQQYRGSKRIYPIFHQPHFIPFNKPADRAAHGQGNADGLRFINYTRPILADMGWYELSTWNLTANASSFDGTHYGLEPNYLKATMLVNFLDILTS